MNSDDDLLLGKPEEVVQKRMDKDKELLVEQLKKTPIVSVACEKTGTSRATYYRWKKEDMDFSQAADTAIAEGSQLINDLAESQLLSTIKNQNLTAIIFWLKHHHPAYSTKVEVMASLKTDEELTPEQEALVTKALKLAALIPADDVDEVKEETHEP